MNKAIVLLCLAAALGCAYASRELSSDATGRHLLQTPNATDCARSVANCRACRYQFFRGTVT